MATWPFRGNYGDNYTKITSSTTETVIVPGYSEKFANLRRLIITNTSATACKVTIKDGLGGATRLVVDVPTRTTLSIDFEGDPNGSLEQTVMNKPWTATCTTSVDSIEITALLKNS